MATVRKIGFFPAAYGCLSPGALANQQFLNFFATCRLSVDEAMDFFWRVKRWKHTWFGASQVEANDSSFLPETEKGLVCGHNYFDALYSLARDGSVPPNDYRFLWFARIPRAQAGATIYYFEDTNTYLPVMLFQSGYAPASFEKVDYLTFRGTFSYGPAYYIIQPGEWWEYDPGDGYGPIYDSITGQQLRPFPS